MGLTYFKRYRMEIGLGGTAYEPPSYPADYHLVGWDPLLIEAHADTKYRSFRLEIDANVFSCLGNREGCLNLMREITRRDGFLPYATWLIEHRPPAGKPEFCGTIQGIIDKRGMGSIQNIGVTPEHRGLGLGGLLVFQALQGFGLAGVQKTYLEVTAHNTGALRLYERLGFRTVKTVYKTAEVACAQL